MSSIGDLLKKTNIYSYNVSSLDYNKAKFNKGELELVDVSLDNRDVCSFNDEFLIVGNSEKNFWFYSIVGMVPVLNHVDGNKHQLYFPNIFFSYWEKKSNYPCVLVFNDMGIDYHFDKDKYDILFANDSGTLLKRKS